MPSFSHPSRSDTARTEHIVIPDDPLEPYGFSWPSENLTTFVGREQELRTASELLRQRAVRLLTLTGPGGVGKTRLAIRLAEEVAPDYRDGIVVILLSSVTDPLLLPGAIAHTLGIRDISDHQVQDRVRAALVNRRLLLVLDNFEQIAGAAPEIANLLGSCPDLTILVTSRVPLHLVGEYEFAVPPLPVPDGGEFSLTMTASVPAVSLFVQRARAVRSDFVLRESNAAAVVEVCRRLDGLPLAIELAAARSKVLSPPALLARLGNGLDLLTGGPQDQPARLRTMRGAIDWSFDLLSADEQAIFCRLAVFTGGFSLDAAEAIAQPVAESGDVEGSLSILDALSSLVDSSLLRSIEIDSDEPRFSMLGAIREFGLEHLQVRGENAVIRDRHARYYLALAEAGEPYLYGGPQQFESLDRFETEHDNLRAALAWAEQQGDALTMQRIGGAIFWFWYLRGHLSEGRQWLNRSLALDAADVTGAELIRARALLGAGMLAHTQGDDAETERLSGESLRICRAANAAGGTIFALASLGLTAEDAGDFERAAALFDEARELHQASGGGGLPETVVPLLNAHIGLVAWGQGAHERAVAIWETSLDRHRALDDPWGAANVCGYLALAATQAGDLELAAGWQQESLSFFLKAGSVVDVADGIAKTAAIAGLRGDAANAARFFGAADAFGEVTGNPPVYPERVVYDRVLNRVRSILSPDTFAAAYAAGKALSLTRAAAEALQVLDEVEPTSLKPADALAGSDLTVRELEVLRLLVSGQTDREIAASLYISPRTAQGHVAHIFNKLGVNTRTAAVAIAISSGLVPSRGS